MKSLIIAMAVNGVCAFFDEYTTQMAIAKGDIEGNKVLDWFYRGDRPTALQGYGIGAALEAAEFTFYAVMTRYAHVSAWVFVALCAAEAGVHVACAISNYKLAKTGKALFTL